MYLAEYILNYTRYLFTMVDHFTKFEWTILIKNKKTKTTYSASKRWSTSYLKPKFLYIDNGEEFLNKVMENYLKQNNIDHITGGPYNHPQHQWAVERLVKLFKIFWYQLKIIMGIL